MAADGLEAAASAGRSGGPGEAHRAWSQPSLQRHVVHDRADGRSETVLLIEGLRCAGCVLSLERALTALPGIERVRINAASRRARVTWDPGRTPFTRLLDTIAEAGFRPLPLDARALDDARRDEQRDALKRLLVAGFGAMQAMMYASALYVGAIDPMDEATRELFRWLGFLIATPVVLYSARPFFAGAARALHDRRLGMDVPVALAVALVYGASLAAALSGGGEVYFDSVSMFVFFLLAGRYLEMRGRHRAGDLTDALDRLTPPVAERRRADGSLEPVAVHDLAEGEHVHVDSGHIVPVDGTVSGAGGRFDESLLTGESTPCRREPGDAVLAGSLVVEGPVEVRVERVGDDTTVAGIAALVNHAQAERPRLARAGERIVGAFVAMVLTLAASTALIWGFLDPARMFTAVVAVLVVSCPCAFALAVPAAITRTLSVLAGRGVLVTRSDAIEGLASATHVVFDKTGTLTDGLHVSRIRLFRGAAAGAAGRTDAIDGERLRRLLNGPPAADDHPALQALRLAGALARESRHPSSRAIAAAAGDLDCGRAGDVCSHPGLGLTGQVAGRTLRLGRPAHALQGMPEMDCGDGVVLADDAGPIAVFEIDERLREGTLDAIAALQREGLAVEIASGDAPERVGRIADRLGVTRWQGAMLPEDKLARLRELRAAGARVVAVGDGVNDAPVLAGADVAVGLAGGTDLARAASDVVLAGERLDQLAGTRALAGETLAVVRQNQRWALVYNLVAIPLAACGFVPPWLAAIGMSASSLGVVLNALRIGRRRGSPGPVVPGLRVAEA